VLVGERNNSHRAGGGVGKAHLVDANLIDGLPKAFADRHHHAGFSGLRVSGHRQSRAVVCYQRGKVLIDKAVEAIAVARGVGCGVGNRLSRKKTPPVRKYQQSGEDKDAIRHVSKRSWHGRWSNPIQFTHPDFEPHGASVRVISTKRIFPFLILNASLTASVRGVRKNGGE
jgi:hypothetical protein